MNCEKHLRHRFDSEQAEHQSGSDQKLLAKKDFQETSIYENWIRRHNAEHENLSYDLDEHVSANGLLMLNQVNSRQQGVLKVKNKRCIAAFFACLAMVTFGNVSTSMAQASVGLVDIGLIFESHPTFSKKLEALKLKADQFKSSSLQRQQNLMKRAEVLRNYEVGSDNYRNAESQLAQESAKMEVADKDTMRQLMREEARLHYNTYREVNQAVSEHCKAVGTKLVLRYNSQEMDPKKPSTVMQGVNGNIVFHQPSVDITQDVIARLVRMQSTASVPGTQAPR